MTDAKECVDGIKAYDNPGLDELVPPPCSLDGVFQNQPPPYMPPPYPMTPYPAPVPPEPGFITDPTPQYWPKHEEQNPPAETEGNNTGALYPILIFLKIWNNNQPC